VNVVDHFLIRSNVKVLYMVSKISVISETAWRVGCSWSEVVRIYQQWSED